MKIGIAPLCALAALALSSCAPVVQRPTERPLVTKVSTNGYAGPAVAAPGQEVTVQGRNLGGASNSVVIFGADSSCEGGVRSSTADVVRWNPSEVVVKVPAAARPGGGNLCVEVAGVRSMGGLPFNVSQAQ